MFGKVAKGESQRTGKAKRRKITPRECGFGEYFYDGNDPEGWTICEGGSHRQEERISHHLCRRQTLATRAAVFVSFISCLRPIPCWFFSWRSKAIPRCQQQTKNFSMICFRARAKFKPSAPKCELHPLCIHLSLYSGRVETQLGKATVLKQLEHGRESCYRKRSSPHEVPPAAHAEDFLGGCFRWCLPQ